MKLRTHQQSATAEPDTVSPDLLRVAKQLFRDHQLMEPHHEQLCQLCLASKAAITQAEADAHLGTSGELQGHEFVSAGKLALLLDVSPNFLLKRAKLRLIPHVREGDAVRFPKQAILQDWHERAKQAVDG